MGSVMAISSLSHHIQETVEEFTLVDRDAVLSYLMNEMNVVPHLAKLVQQAKAIYGENTLVSLRRDRDPDADSEYLVVGIRTEFDPTDAHELLYRLREEWWATTPSDVEDQILVANEYV